MADPVITVFALMTMVKAGADYQPAPVTKPDVQACSEMMDPAALKPKWRQFKYVSSKETATSMHYVFRKGDKELDMTCDGLAVTVREQPAVASSLCYEGGRCVNK